MNGHRDAERRAALAGWVAREVLPHEPHVRHWLRRSGTTAEDADEIIQEAYCRIAMLGDVDHIDNAHAYFFSIVRNLLVRRLKRQRIVPLETIAEVDAWHDDRPSPEQAAAGRMAYAKALDMIGQLPERCRRIVQLRKIEGWSQRRIAEHLGTTEKAVEKQVWLGVRALREAWSRAEQEADTRMTTPAERHGGRRW
ncbi:MAG: sigma-70 family RNA polymerase sigma factor [Sphingomonas phyllosphaerae]|uniref:RNA polymerase sigma factor n=1 Tax=Sphingomonas phyllosphaerae TaxID=257003 RepID=UPI002FF4F5AA